MEPLIAHQRRKPAEREVLRDGEVGNQVQLLVDHHDALPLRFGDAVEAERAALGQDGARVRGQRSAEHLHQRGLAGPVLADQRMDLPGFQREVDALKGRYSAEALLDAAHLQKGHELF